MPSPTKDLLEIDLNRLEECCQEQPQLMIVWGTKLVEARKAVKLAKNRIKLRAAKLDPEIRANPIDFGFEKISEKAIEYAIIKDLEYQEELKDLIQLEYEEDVLDIFFKTLVDRRGELENLTKLFGQMYWSKPNTVERMSERQRNAIEGEAVTPRKKKKE